MKACYLVDTDEPNIFSEEEIRRISGQNIPKHIAVIMDGNRRWAQRENLPPLMGHWRGAETLSQIVRAAMELEVQTLTVYAFSTENWNRSPEEILSLMQLFEVYLQGKKSILVKKGIRLDVIGDIRRLPLSTQKNLNEVRAATEAGTKFNLVLALNYGGRDEIRRAIVQIIKHDRQNPFLLEEITEDFVEGFLDTRKWGNPDLLIRTSGELRVSNFMLWQISYTEFYVSQMLWPEFSPQELMQAVLTYQIRDRRLGGG